MSAAVVKLNADKSERDAAIYNLKIIRRWIRTHRGFFSYDDWPTMMASVERTLRYVERSREP